MKEIEVRDNKYGIEKIVLSEGENFINTASVELIVNILGDPKGEKFAENILFHQDMAISENDYEPDSFNVKLPVANHIKMTGNIKDIVDFLKTIKIVDIDTIQTLENYIKPFLSQSSQSRSDFFNAKPKSDLSSDDKLDVEGEVRELINSFKPEDRPKALTLLKLSGKLEPEKRMALQESLSAQIIPNRGSNTPTRS